MRPRRLTRPLAVLPAMRCTPAIGGGGPVTPLGQTPFQFRLTH